MSQETEIKLKIADPAALKKSLKKLGAVAANPGASRVHEWNVIFDTPQGGLAKHGQLLRIRTETAGDGRKGGKAAPKPRVVLTFKRPAIPAYQATEAAGAGTFAPAGRHKVREEIEVEVADGKVLAQIFEGLGMSGWFRYEKYRTTLKLPGTKSWAKGLLIEVDETPVGTYVELEGPPEAIDRAAQELGYSKKEYVLKNYLTLYAEDCRRRGETPRDMVFPEKARAARSV